VIIDKRTRHRLAASTRFTDLREFEAIDSTNTYLLAEAKGGAAEGVVAIADYQRAGRGRLGRTWTAPPGGSLLASILLRPSGLATGRRHLITSAVGLAARSAVESVAGLTAELKWPNDLLLGERKLAGILAEAEGDAVVVGLGVNVSGAPPGAAAVNEGAGRPVDRGRLLEATLVELESWYGRWDEVASTYRERCATVGRLVRVELPGRTLVGRTEAINDDGHLVVRPSGDGDLVEVTAGDVIHLRPAEL
jgi:BirA family transcriptional regulator, biotin operon repressor / biotin---[acetyl-CoA-carboxylase] ligase